MASSYVPDDGLVSSAAQRFQWLVGSPLRVELLRFLHARPNQTFDLETLTGALGCMRVDAERCLEALVNAGAALRGDPGGNRFGASRPLDPAVARLLDGFLAQPAVEHSRTEPPSVRKLMNWSGATRRCCSCSSRFARRPRPISRS